MKRTLKTNWGAMGMLCLLLLSGACKKLEFSKDMAGFDTERDLAQFSLRLYGFGTDEGERVADFGEGAVYKIEDVATTPQKVDLVSFWTEEDGVSFVSVRDIPALSESEEGQVMNREWHVKNQTTFVRLEANEAYKARYDDITEAQHVRNLYEWALEEVTEQPNYDPALHGPYMSVKGLSEGDLLLIKTEGGAYAAAVVGTVSPGETGSIRLFLKVDIRDYVAVPALAPSQRMDVYEVRVDRPGSESGQRYLDFSTGTTYVRTHTDYTAGVIYHQERVDMVFHNREEGRHHFMSPDDDETLGLWSNSGQWAIDDWMVRNTGSFIRLAPSDYADSLYTFTYQNSHIRNAWSEVLEKVENDPEFGATSGRGPGKYINEIGLGDLILFKSESKNIYAMAKVTQHSLTSTSSGHAVLSVKVDNSSKIEVIPPSIKILTGRSTAGMTFIDFETGETVLEAGGAALAFGPGRFDIAHSNGNTSNHNFFSPASENFTGFNEALQGRINEWPVRNHTELIRLSSGDFTDQLFRSLSDGDYAGMMAVWEAAKEEQEPTDRLTGLGVGQVVLINSVDRGRFIVVRILRANTNNTTGSLAIEYKMAVRP